MRSPTSSHRRLHPRPSPPRPIDAIAALIDETTVDEPGQVAVHVIDDGDDVVLGTRVLDAGTHPFAELAGLSAPADWAMFGLRLRGTARHLDGDRPPQRSSTTFLMSRAGEERSILRTDEGPTPLPGPAAGTIPDLCRRVLGRPTAPAPATTAALWTVAWLDRLVEALGDPERRRPLSASWRHVAVLHPAARSAPHPLDLDDPARLVAVARAHTAAWGWSRLRAEPDALTLPDGHLPSEITGWMDDGFYARWALGAFPSPVTLAHDLTGLLDPTLREPFLEALAGLLD